jgi:hypothetical protein
MTLLIIRCVLWIFLKKKIQKLYTIQKRNKRTTCHARYHAHIRRYESTWKQMIEHSYVCHDKKKTKQTTHEPVYEHRIDQQSDWSVELSCFTERLDCMR